MLLPFLNHYDIPESDIRVEAMIANSFLQQKKTDFKSIHDVYTEVMTAPECFPKLSECLQIAMTIGVTSATAERSFSSLRRMKTYLRSTMTQDRLTNLALLYIERKVSGQLWDNLDTLVIKLAEKHSNSRIVLL